MKKLLTFLFTALLAIGVGWAETVTDVLNQSWTGISGTNYTNFNGKTATSSAVYAGNCAGGNSAIQLRSSNNNSGIVTTMSGGKVRRVIVVWYSGTSSGRTIDVYGKNTAYDNATDLYNSNYRGTKLGSIVYGTSTTLDISGDYEYIGFRSASGALYATSVTIVWETGGDTPVETVATPTFSPAGGTYTEAQNVTINCTTSGANIYYTTNGDNPTESSTLYEGPISVSETTTIKAIAVKSGMNNSEVAEATYTINSTPVGGNIFKKVTSASQLVAGKKYILVYETTPAFMGAIGTDGSWGKSVTGPTISNNQVDISNYSSIVQMTLGGSANDGWTFLLPDGKYMALTGDANALHTAVSVTNSSRWTVAGGASGYTLNNMQYTTRFLQYNAGSPRFACYKGTQQPAYLYIEDSSAPAVDVEEPVITPASGSFFTAPTVSMTIPTGTTVHYTTDGNDPTSASATYSEPFALQPSGASTTVKAVAIDGDGNLSNVVSVVYTWGAVAANVAGANALTDNTPFMFSGDAVVTYCKGKYIYVRDNSGSGLIYQNSDFDATTYHNSVVLSQNWYATKTTYSGLPEFKDVSGLSASGNTATAEPEVLTQTITDVDLNKYVQINGVTNYADGATILGATVREAQFGIHPTVESGKTYNIVACVGKFNNTYQLYPIDVILVDVEEPVITPATGTYYGDQTVTITVPAGTTVYYTTDGNDPTSSSNAYSAPFTVQRSGASTTVKAVAIDGAGNLSDVVSETYTWGTVTVAISPATQNFSGASTVSGTITATPADATVEYSFDNTTWQSYSDGFTTPDVAVGGNVTVYARATKDGQTATDQATYTREAVEVTAPTFTIGGETVTGTQGVDYGTVVTITAPSGCCISYTTDGTDPTESGTAIITDGNTAEEMITEGVTIMAATVDENADMSAVVTLTLTINPLAVTLNPATASDEVGNTIEVAVSANTAGDVVYGYQSSPAGATVTETETGFTITSATAGTYTVTASALDEIDREATATGTYTFTAPVQTCNAFIEFDDNGVDASTAVTNSSIWNYITAGSDYISSVSDIARVYQGATGLKFSSSSSNGNITFNLEQDHQDGWGVRKIMLNAKAYGSSENARINITAYSSEGTQNGTSQQLTDSFDDYEFNFDGRELTGFKVFALNRLYLKSITIEYACVPPVVVPMPTIEPGAGTYYADQTVTITVPAGTTVYYTTDGSTPSADNGTEYTGTFTASYDYEAGSTTIKAIAIDGDDNSSDVASVVYTWGAFSVTINPASKTFYGSANMSGTITATPDDAAIEYSFDGTTWNNYSDGFTTPDVAIGGSVTVYARATMDGNTVTDQATYTRVAAPAPAAPTFSREGGEVRAGTVVTITAPEGCTLYVNGVQVNDNPHEVTITEATTIEAYAVNSEGTSSSTVSYSFTIKAATGDFELMTSTSQLVDGDEIIFVSSDEAGEAKAMGAQNNNNRAEVDVVVTDDLTVEAVEGVQIITLEAGENGWYFNVGNGYLYAASGGSNHLKTEAEIDANGNALAEISIGNDHVASVVFQGNNLRNVLQYNHSSHLFSCYGSATQSPVYIYYRHVSHVPAPVISPATGTYYESQNVTITAGEDCTIYYTTDGTEPTTASNQYDGTAIPVSLNELGDEVVIKAIAVKNGLTSDVATATYKYVEQLVNVNAPFFSPLVNNTYYGDQTLEIGCTTNNADIYYEIIEVSGATAPAAGSVSDPGNTSTFYNAPVPMTVGHSYYVKAVAYVGSTPSVISEGWYIIKDESEFEGESGVTYVKNCKEFNDLTTTGTTVRFMNPVQVVYHSTYTNNGEFAEFCYVRDNTDYACVYFGKRDTGGHHIFNMGDWIDGSQIEGVTNVWERNFHIQLGTSDHSISSWPSTALGWSEVIPTTTTCSQIASGTTDGDNMWGNYVHVRYSTMSGVADYSENDPKHTGSINDATGANTYYDKFYRWSAGTCVSGSYHDDINCLGDYDQAFFTAKQNAGATFDVYGIVDYYSLYTQPFEVCPIDFLWIYKPVMTPVTGEYTTTQTVDLTATQPEWAAEGVVIYYKTDDMEDWAVYNGAFDVNSTTTVQAYAEVPARKNDTAGTDYNDYVRSQVVEATYTFANIADPVITPESSVIEIVTGSESVSGSVSTNPDSAPGTVTIYTTNGEDPRTSSEVYTVTDGSDDFTFDETTTVTAISYYETDGGETIWSNLVSETYTFVKKNGVEYTLCKAAPVVGNVYVIVNKANQMGLSTQQNANNRGSVGVMFKENTNKDVVYGNDELAQFTLEAAVGGRYYFKTLNGNQAGYLCVEANDHANLVTEAAHDANGADMATVNIGAVNADVDKSYVATISYNYNGVTRYLRYFNGSHVFSTYSDGTLNEDVFLYGIEATPLAYVEASGEVGKQYIISDQLVGAWAINDGTHRYLWAKDQGNVSIDKTFPREDQTDYMRDLAAQDNPLGQYREWDQSNWVVLDFKNIDADPADYVNKKIQSATVSGEYVDDLNFRIQLEGEAPVIVAEAATGYPGYLADPTEANGVEYFYNNYTPVNFVAANLNTDGNDGAVAGPDSRAAGRPLFFMNPKIQEIAHVWAVYAGTSDGYDKFDVYECEPGYNGNDLSGSFYVSTGEGWIYNNLGEAYGRPVVDGNFTLEADNDYCFHILVNRTSNGYGPRRAQAKDSERDANFRVYPLDIPLRLTPTSVTDVTGTKAVASVHYYNIMGMESEQPFEGVNIVVTRYTDGTATTTKVLR